MLIVGIGKNAEKSKMLTFNCSIYNPTASLLTVTEVLYITRIIILNYINLTIKFSINKKYSQYLPYFYLIK